MDSTQKFILKQVDVLERIHKTLTLLEKKKERMGLTEEEQVKYTDIKKEYFYKYDVMIEDIFTYLIKNIITSKAEKALKKIQSFISWDGGAILSDIDYHRIMAEASVLKDSSFEEIEKNLAILHSEVFVEFAAFISTENGYNYCIEMARTISFGMDEEINRVIQYLDLRYRDFAVLLEIDLPEIQLVFNEFEDEDDDDEYDE